MTHAWIIGLSLFLQGAPAESPEVAPETAAAPAETKDAAGDPQTPAAPAGDAAAQETAGETKSEEESPSWLKDFLSTGALGMMIDGGIFMWPILLMGIVAAGVIIERYRSLKMLRTDSSQLRREVQQLMQADQIEEALEKCENAQGPVAAILSVGLRKFLILRRLGYDAAKIEEQVVKAMDDYGVHVIAALEKHTPILATVASAAPTVGFLGTVAGMITSFKDIVAQLGDKSIIEAAAAGISVALLTTAFGLIVGLPAFVAFNYFSGVVNEFVLEVEEAATELIEGVTLQMALEQAEVAAE
jgi:biopolymer transport protein ExbB